MAEYKFLAALNVAKIPFVSTSQPRSVLMGQLDNRVRDPSTNTTINLDNNPTGLPQILYAENIMPTGSGVMTIGYEKTHNAGPTSNFDDVFLIRDAAENERLFAPARGLNYVDIAGVWTSTNPVAGAPLAVDTAPFSIAYVNGVTYICYANMYIGHWDGVNFVDDSASLLGVNVIEIRCIVGAGNYLVLSNYHNEIQWSSLSNALDFIPSSSTGAGKQIPNDIRGAPYFLSQISGGFLIHCGHNTIAAAYTENVTRPWIFREVKNAGSSYDFRHFSRETNSGFIFAWTNHGLQQMDMRTAEHIHADANDFLGERLYETYDATTKLLTLNTVTSNFRIKVAHLMSRYLVVSYGLAADVTYFAAVIYDYSHKRWGKINAVHTDIILQRTPNHRDNLYYVTANGEIWRFELGSEATVDSGVLILGRYQINRTHQTCSQELELELLNAAEWPSSVSVASSYNGATPGIVLPMVVAESPGNYRRYQKQIEGENLSYIIEGNFTLATVLMTNTLGARF